MKISKLSLAIAVVIFANRSSLAAELENGDFQDGITGWTDEGEVSIITFGDGNSVALIEENIGGPVSRIFQIFELPSNALMLSFQFRFVYQDICNPEECDCGSAAASPPPDGPSLFEMEAGLPDAGLALPDAEPTALETPTADGSKQTPPPGDSITQDMYGSPQLLGVGTAPDAFIAFLTTPDGSQRLVVPPDCDPDFTEGFYWMDNDDATPPRFCSPYVTLGNEPPAGFRTVTLDISSLTAGQSVRVEFGMVDGCDGLETFVQVDNVLIHQLNQPPEALCQNITLTTSGS